MTEPTETLLREIRDTQREHLELYKQALANQEASIRSQQEAIAYQKRMMTFGLRLILPIIAIVIGLVVWLMLGFL